LWELTERFTHHNPCQVVNCGELTSCNSDDCGVMKTNSERMNIFQPKWSEIVAGTKNSGGELISRNSDDCEMLVCKTIESQEVGKHSEKKISDRHKNRIIII
jgi:hypothetical protein